MPDDVFSDPLDTWSSLRYQKSMLILVPPDIYMDCVSENEMNKERERERYVCLMWADEVYSNVLDAWPSPYHKASMVTLLYL